MCLFLMIIMTLNTNLYIWIFNTILVYVFGIILLISLIIEIREIIKDEKSFLNSYVNRYFKINNKNK